MRNNNKKVKVLEIGQANSIIRKAKDTMKGNKNVYISLGIILLTVVVGGFLVFSKKDSVLKKDVNSTSQVISVGLKFTEKDFKLNYSSYNPDSVLEISDFEKNEEWLGNYEFDSDTYWTGDSSLIVESKDNEKIDVYLNRKTDLTKYQVFRLAVYLQTDPNDIESVRLYFGNNDKSSYYAYPLTNLQKGWNFLRIQKLKFSAFNAIRESLMKVKKNGAESTPLVKPSTFNWNMVERIGFEVISRANVNTSVNFDSLKALESDDYLDDWLMVNPVILDLAKFNDKIMIKAKNVGSSIALIKKLTGLSNFTFKAKVIPQRTSARSGLFIRGDYKSTFGYYFLIDGLGGNRWQVIKYASIEDKPQTIILKNGTINNFMVEKDKPLWLKVEAKGDNMKFYLSTDSKSFTKLGEINDGDIKEGGVGLAVYDNGASLFDEFELQQ